MKATSSSAPTPSTGSRPTPTLSSVIRTVKTAMPTKPRTAMCAVAPRSRSGVFTRGAGADIELMPLTLRKRADSHSGADLRVRVGLSPGFRLIQLPVCAHEGVLKGLARRALRQTHRPSAQRLGAQLPEQAPGLGQCRAAEDDDELVAPDS